MKQDGITNSGVMLHQINPQIPILTLVDLEDWDLWVYLMQHDP